MTSEEKIIKGSRLVIAGFSEALTEIIEPIVNLVGGTLKALSLDFECLTDYSGFIVEV